MGKGLVFLISLDVAGFSVNGGGFRLTTCVNTWRLFFFE